MKITYRDPGTGNLIQIDPDVIPVELLLTKADKKGIADMPKDCHSVVMFPDGMDVRAAYRILGRPYLGIHADAPIPKPKEGDQDARPRAVPNL